MHEKTEYRSWPQDRSTRPLRSVPRLAAIALGSLALIVCGNASAPASWAENQKAASRDLLIAYDILAETLSDESKLKWLGLLKRVTFDRTAPEVEDLLKRISASASERSDELEDLRNLPPDVSMEPAGTDPIGDAITAMAKEAGTSELMEGDAFGLRFVVLQAQATRMVAAIAEAAAQVETQPRRKAWLESLAAEYEGLREELLDVLELYVLQKGAAQQAQDG